MTDPNKQKSTNAEVVRQQETILQVRSQIKAGPGIRIGRPPAP